MFLYKKKHTKYKEYTGSRYILHMHEEIITIIIITIKSNISHEKHSEYRTIIDGKVLSNRDTDFSCWFCSPVRSADKLCNYHNIWPAGKHKLCACTYSVLHSIHEAKSHNLLRYFPHPRARPLYVFVRPEASSERGSPITPAHTRLSNSLNSCAKKTVQF